MTRTSPEHGGDQLGLCIHPAPRPAEFEHPPDSFNLGNAIGNPASPDNQFLKPGDVITIFSRSDLPLPMDKHATFVRVSGEINAPGVYRVEPGDTLRNVVERAGGLTPHSYLYAAQLTRESTRKAEEEQLQVSIAQMQRELTSRYAAASSITSANAAEQQTQLSTAASRYRPARSS